jgi:hypothetical protein
MFVKLSELTSLSGSLNTNDFVEICKNLGNGNYSSFKSTIQQISDFVYEQIGFQYGGISGSWFSGEPKTYMVNLLSPYSDTSYTITITGEDIRLWSVFNKSTSSFGVSSNSNVSFEGYVYWRTDKL